MFSVGRLAAALGLVVLGMAGCGRSRYAQLWVDYAERVCACKDLPCWEEERKDMEKVLRDYGEPGGSREDGEAVVAANERIEACVADLEKLAQEEEAARAARRVLHRSPSAGSR